MPEDMAHDNSGRLTVAYLRHALAHLPSDAPIDLVIQEFTDDPDDSAVATHFDLEACQVHNGRVLLITNVQHPSDDTLEAMVR